MEISFLSSSNSLISFLPFSSFVSVAFPSFPSSITRFKITGGEPLVRKDCVQLISEIKSLNGVEQVTLTTNGVLLEKQAGALKRAGVDCINVSLDTLDPRLYRQITGQDALEKVVAGILQAEKLDIPVHANTVLQKSINDAVWQQVLSLAEKGYADVRVEEDECNDTYERCRMNQALKLKYPNEDVPSERTVYRIMERIGLSHRPNRKPHGITKADRNARKSENLLNRDFRAGSPLKKCVTDITEIPAKNGKLFVSAIFNCYDLDVLGLSMSDNMKTELCTSTIENMVKSNPSVCGMILHSDRGSQYTSASYRAELSRHGIIQSMNSDGGRCHDNARCEAMWARMKEELLYGRYDTKQMTIEELKTLIWRYFIIYWNNRRICSANGGLPPMIKRKKYYESLGQVA